MFIFYLYISPYIITHFLHLINRFFCLTEKISGIFLLIKAFGRGRSLIHLCGSNSTYTSIIKQQQQVHRIHSCRQQQSLLAFFYLYISPYIITRFLSFVKTFSTFYSRFLHRTKWAQQCALWRRTFIQAFAAARFRALQNCGSSSNNLIIFFIYIYIPLYYNTFCAPLQWNKLLNNIKIAAIILIAHFFLRL